MRGQISVVKRCHSLARCRCSLDGMARTGRARVIAGNPLRIGSHLEAARERQRLAASAWGKEEAAFDTPLISFDPFDAGIRA